MVTHKAPLLTRQLSSNLHKLLQVCTGHAHVGLSWGWQSRHCQTRGSCGGPGTWAACRPRLASAARTLNPCAAGAYMPAHPYPACRGPRTRRPRNIACWFATLGPAQTNRNFHLGNSHFKVATLQGFPKLRGLSCRAKHAKTLLGSRLHVHTTRTHAAPGSLARSGPIGKQ